MRYVLDAYHLDPQRYELHRAGVLIPLRPKVFQGLAYLVAQHERVVRKEELLEVLWPGQLVGNVGLNTYIMEVRKALGDRRPPDRGPMRSRPRAGEYGKAREQSASTPWKLLRCANAGTWGLFPARSP